ncbi:glycosyltransferase family 4 protein [Anabaena sp. FACHB-709]|uniref:Glycosyltransferase n=2 Tax=Nostocaceae TaxID=1162 RepID=A0A1Z4KPC5_ANAVA|nr:MULTISPECIES: glycosyltransferase family 4 protein [Nostocaceae]BAY70822.1 glycosyltransferase [Trichormus variabilis NIES-23]HBW30515.1 glycosyltransferase WbuB [Nostoc sp. UBA8866]MBD2171228.1 glycosyltransferase family 4 protein [Anabaena cylindrica FACHB-318]MBD2263102.1 glycosyltransferase family 4 protein [Anabaena sp. FACHB-709]MBD2272555.1 glycosyltransferase family 4 protein [Nostoc sp. PCC 7120 = FACHB-418]
MRLNEWINNKFIQSISTPIEAENTSTPKTQKSIKLSVMTQFFPPDYAPTGQLIEELVKQLGQQGVNVEVFTSQPGYAFQSQTAPAVEWLDRIRIQRSRTAQLWSGRIRGKAVNGVLYTLRALLHILKAWRRNNILLVTTAPPFLPIIGYLAYLLFRLPYVCVLYDLYPDIAIALGVVSKRSLVVRLWNAMNRQVWLNAKGIVVLSPAMKQKIVAHCPEVTDKISVIHSWANPEAIVPIPKSENWFAHEYGLVNKFTVLYSGNMGRCHDIDTMLEAAKLLQNEPIQFVCIGGGAKREELIREVDKLGLNNFTFLPYQDKQVLPYSLTACDLSLVSVDATTEGLVVPSKLYSALASGRPIAVICSQSSYLREMMAEAKCGGSFENGDSQGLAQFIRFLSRDTQIGEDMGKAGRQYMRSHFTPKVISQQYLRVLQQALFSHEVVHVSRSNVK